MDKKELDALRKQYKQKLDEAQGLARQWEGKSIPTEVAERIDAALGATDELKAKIVMGERLSAGEDFLGGSDGPKAAMLGWRQSSATEGNPEVDEKAWREIEIPTVFIDPIYKVPVAGKRAVRFHIPLAVQAKGYAGAFEAYTRRGKSELGPADFKTLTEGSDSAGGFLVPEDYHVELIRKIATMATIRANARVISTSRDIAKWPKVHYTTDDKYTSGVRLTWTGESPASATAHRVTDPVFGLYAIPVHTAMASMPLSNDMLEDSAFDVAGISSDMLAEAFALGENDAFINGSGSGQPQGILTSIGSDGPAYVASSTASTLTADGLIDLAYALPSQYERNAKWYFAKSTEKVIRKLKTDDKQYLWPVVSNVGNFGPVNRDLLGFPTVREEFVPAIAANDYPIIFGDMMGYMIVDRVGFSIQRLSELYAETNVTLLLARKRVGGQTVEPWRMKVQKVAAS